MALNIKDSETIKLADEVASLAGENKTRAVRTALEERKRRLGRGGGSALERHRRLVDLLEREIWPQVPEQELGKATSRKEREEILGYGPEGV
jgi:antitoxin VapB